jgi:hypothetical protein
MSQELLIASLVFLLVSSPQMYRATSGLLGSWVANANGSPSTTGLLLHAAVFGAIVFLATPRKSEGFVPAGTTRSGLVAMDPAKWHRATDGKWRKNSGIFASGDEFQYFTHILTKKPVLVTNPSNISRNYRRYG